MYLSTLFVSSCLENHKRQVSETNATCVMLLHHVARKAYWNYWYRQEKHAGLGRWWKIKKLL